MEKMVKKGKLDFKNFNRNETFLYVNAIPNLFYVKESILIKKNNTI